MAYTTIDNPELYYQSQLYVGNGSANHAITLGGSEDMQPDLVWIKNRDATDAHCWFDSVRGATKFISCNTTLAEATDADTLDSFTSDGFQVDADDKVNTNTENYIAYCWKESAVSGFDIVQYSGTGSAQNISHSLSAVPHFILVKQHDTGRHWALYHHKNTDAPETDYLTPTTDVATTDASTFWNDTAPTSSVFSVGSVEETNGSGTNNIVAYLFSEKQGFSKFGVYTANGNADGPFVYTGFRPAHVTFIKSTTGGFNWDNYDNKRAGYNSKNHRFLTDQNSGESTSGNNIDLLSNGFKVITDNETVNSGTNTYVYAAFAHSPFVNSKGVPTNAR